MFRRVCTGLPYPVQVLRILDDDFRVGIMKLENLISKFRLCASISGMKLNFKFANEDFAYDIEQSLLQYRSTGPLAPRNEEPFLYQRVTVFFDFWLLMINCFRVDIDDSESSTFVFNLIQRHILILTFCGSVSKLIQYQIPSNWASMSNWFSWPLRMQGCCPCRPWLLPEAAVQLHWYSVPSGIPTGSMYNKVHTHLYSVCTML